jgi:hypothetical protein
MPSSVQICGRVIPCTAFLPYLLLLLLLFPIHCFSFAISLRPCPSSCTKTCLHAGLTWRADEIYHSQPDFPVLFLATRNESYARDIEGYFSSQGYFVRSCRTLTRLVKMVQSTRPEGILISDHLSTSHIQGFLTSLKRLPDLWLIPVLIICDSTPTPSPAPSKLIQEGTVRSEEGGELEVRILATKEDGSGAGLSCSCTQYHARTSLVTPPPLHVASVQHRTPTTDLGVWPCWS